MELKLSFLKKYGDTRHLEPYVGHSNSIVDALTSEQYHRHAQTAPLDMDLLDGVVNNHKKRDLFLTQQTSLTLYHRLRGSTTTMHKTMLNKLLASSKHLVNEGLNDPDARNRAISLIHSYGIFPSEERAKHLERLSTDESSMVREYVARDTDTPKHSLDALENDVDEKVSSSAKTTKRQLGL